MRRTMFVVPTPPASIVQHSSSAPVAARLRRALVKELGAVVDDPDPWLADVEDAVVARFRELGGATGVALSRADERLRTKLVVRGGEGLRRTGRDQQPGAEHPLRAGPHRPRAAGGGWTGSQYEWAPIEKWLPDGLPALDAEPRERSWSGCGWPVSARAPWPTSSGGPAGTRATPGGRWRDRHRRGRSGRRAGLVLAADTEPVPEPEPWIALLPALDPTPMGWSAGTGTSTPTTGPRCSTGPATSGRPCGATGGSSAGGRQRADGDVVWRLFEDIGTE